MIDSNNQIVNCRRLISQDGNSSGISTYITNIVIQTNILSTRDGNTRPTPLQYFTIFLKTYLFYLNVFIPLFYVLARKKRIFLSTVFISLRYSYRSTKNNVHTTVFTVKPVSQLCHNRFRVLRNSRMVTINCQESGYRNTETLTQLLGTPILRYHFIQQEVDA